MRPVTTSAYWTLPGVSGPTIDLPGSQLMDFHVALLCSCDRAAVTVLVQTFHTGARTPGEKLPEVVFAGSEYGCVLNLYPYLPDWLPDMVRL